MKPDPDLTTRLLHSDRRFGVEHGGLHKPIHTSVQYGFETVEDLIGVFQGTLKGAYNYARQGTPTTAALESMLTRMEDGVGSICFSTGMAAIAAVFLTLLRAGDHLIASKHVFGNTNSVFGTLGDFGVEVSKVDATSVAGIAAALQPNTRMVFVETIANPGTQVPDLAAIGAFCREHGLLYVVDNTITSPALFKPARVDAGLVVNSLTKTIAGHGAALGGAVTDTGRFDWNSYPNIFGAYRKGDPSGWGLAQIRKKGLRDLGAALAPEQAHRIALGAETLVLRSTQSSRSALALARFLEAHPAVARVHYPGLVSHPQHGVVDALFSAASWLLSFELKDPSTLSATMNRLRLAVLATGLGDTRTLVIPVAPTIFWEAGAAVRAEMGIADGLIRVSLGLEEEADILADFDQALAGG
ncbi:MAG TPA: cystathionine gamma-synthase family protein [Burkholderiaceae bacterium]|nr:cystathionine gamma-synthase family protein [Burkholderiaceae bacterium]HMX09277.1 cystathionine gamma-synthase family protein [Burkholderiaceae bacterium]HMY98547.1 cystathionine gamma-synthase family protein [Burkholderiaceae bacterium]HNB43208.1 cystathionine gamma-synthase family protein [Burkholderiaceae bacterium]HNG78041.1 cystathionine gamma-synthase family protein [Burkholderiaceae bacterium]